MVAWGMSLTLSLYAQQVLGYTAFEFGLGTAAMTAMTLVGSIAGQSIVTRIGFRTVAAVGMALTGAGCLLLTQVSVHGSYLGDIFFALLVFGPGLGAAYVAASVATLAGVREQESGLASGLNNAAFQIGGALGAAIVTTVAVSGANGSSPSALTEGFQSAFAAAAVFAGLGLLVAARPQTIEGVSGLMNLVMLPMWLLSGTFFSSARFPEVLQPFVKALPLTALNDSLRAVMNEGTPLASNWAPVAVLLAWGLVSFALALRMFRWQ
jgi:MFS family permease